MATAATHEFELGGHRLVYDEYGSGPRTLVLVHGLLLSRKMHAPLASALADRGHRVLCLDLLGHGSSDRPRDMSRYSMPIFAEQVIALLDHVGVDEA
ncbi:MAG TPA: alpha/beta fold hydrolase, partial [Thermoleophilaceae bacterium]|nr:alpha/beta fold hydrolase [Thermoleophilaceae bacterium]